MVRDKSTIELHLPTLPSEEEIFLQSAEQIDAAKKLQDLLLEERAAKMALWAVQRKIMQFWREMRLLRPFESLSPREEQVVTLIKMRMQNKEIAAELNISERTAKYHVSSILAKFGFKRRDELF